MADPLSLTASIVGILSATLHGSKRLFEFIESLQSAPREIAALSSELKGFYETLAELSGMQQQLMANNALCESLKAPLENCLDVLDEFMLTLQTYTQTSRDGTRKVRAWKKLAWAFKDKEIQVFRDTILTYKASLNLAVSAVSMFTTTCIDERTKRMQSDFKAQFKQIQSKLDALDIDRMELASISGEKGSEWHGTNAYFALNRFLECTESICNSPPGSFPGSPVLSPFNAECDIDTAMETISSTADSENGSQHQKPASAESSIPSPENTTRAMPPASFYSRSGFDLIKALSKVTTRKSPKITLGPIDLSCAFVVCDATMNDIPVIHVSDNAQHLTGYSRHEMLGQNCRFLQAPDGKVEAGCKREFVDDGAVFNLRRMIHEGKEVQQSLINYRKGGKPFVNMLTVIPITWDTNAIRYFIGFLTDLADNPDAISSQDLGQIQVNYKQSSMSQYIWDPPNRNEEPDSGQTLSSNEVSTLLQQFTPKEHASDWHKQTWDKMLLENTDDVVYALSLDGLFLYLSPASKRILEYDIEELVGSPLSAVCHPCEIVSATRELKNTTSRNAIDLVFRIRRKHSGYMWFESYGSLFVEQGKGRGCIILVGRERPVLALSRQNIEANGGIGDSELWTKLSTSGLLLFVSSNFRSLLGLQPEDLVGTSIQDLMRQESRPEFGRSIEMARRGKTVTCKHEVQSQRGHIQAQTTLHPGNTVEGEKPLFLLAQMKLLKVSSRNNSAGGSAKSTITGNPTSSRQEGGRVSKPVGISLALGPQETASASTSDDNIFDELRTTNCSSWQFELRKIEKANRVLAEEVGGLLANKKKRRRRKDTREMVQHCANCRTRNTPEWRMGPSGQRDLCNSCGLRWAKQVSRCKP